MLGVVGVPGFGAVNAREVSNIRRLMAGFIVKCGFEVSDRESKRNRLGRKAAARDFAGCKAFN
jgi:hypothetical protein